MTKRRNRISWFVGLYLVSLVLYALVVYGAKSALGLLR